MTAEKDVVIATNGAQPSSEVNDNQLKKNALGLVHCIGMSVAGIGPTCGIYFVVAQIAKVAGANVPFTLMMATVCCLSMASTISTFAKYISSSSSFYCYVSEGLGPATGFITGWFMLVGYGILTVQTVIQFASWTSDVFNNNTGFDFPWPALAVVVLLVVSALAYIGINPALKISLILVTCETIILAVLTTIIVVKGGAEGNYPLAFTPVGKYSGGISGLSRGLVFSILVFIGFESAAILGAETRNPKKTIPRAVIGSVLITAAWMIWGMYAIIIAAGPSNAFTLYTVNSPIDVYARQYVGRWFAVLIDIAGISTTFNVCTVSFNNMYRILYSIGKADLHPVVNLLGVTSPRYKTPIGAIIFFTGCQILFGGIVWATYGWKTKGSWEAYGYLSYIGTLPLIIVFIITNIAIIPYVKNKHPQDFHWFYHVVLPVFSITLFVAVLIGNFYPDTPVPPYTYLLIFLVAAMAFGFIPMLFLRNKKGIFERMLYMISSDGGDNISTSQPQETDAIIQ
eukprot:gene1432-1661_t